MKNLLQIHSAVSMMNHQTNINTGRLRYNFVELSTVVYISLFCTIIRFTADDELIDTSCQVMKTTVDIY